MKNYWNLKSNKRIVSLFFSILPLFAYSQYSKPEIDSADGEKYIYPVNPGQPGSLAGTMGELRSTHFHSGIDIRTNNMIGFPVLASKSGYISRASVSPAGYGNILYVTHPDGNTTLYAHLDKFRGPVAKHILQEQYNQKSFSVDLYFREDQFKVKQGDTIALSGNTGSSSGPHLHFDIRDRNNFALDPLKVASFPEVPDNLPPAPEKIALRTLDINSRINDKFGRFEFYASGSGKKYTMANPILASGTIGLEIIAKDRLATNSPFYGGVNYIEVRVDSQLVFSQAIEKIDIAETRAIYTLMDFKTLRNKGTRFYKLYIDDGNKLGFYQHSPGTGKIQVNPLKESSVRITLKDSYGNTSNVSFRIRPVPVVSNVLTLESVTNPVSAETHENILQLTLKPCSDSLAVKMFSGGTATGITPDYFNNNQSVYLIDLRKNLPDSIVTCHKTIVTNLRKIIPSSGESTYSSEEMEVFFPEGALYDTLFLAASYGWETGNEVFRIGDRTVPLNKPVRVTLKPLGNYSKNLTTSVYRKVGKGFAFAGGQWKNGRIEFTTREFGEYTLLQDLAAPTIRVISADRNGVRFKIRDNLSGIASYEANINGQWLLMHYDSKSATIWSEKLDKSKPLIGTFELIVTDNAGNQGTYTKKIN